jgi:hypothetical protein
VGIIFDHTNDVELPNQAEIAINSEISNIEIPSGDSFGDCTIPTQQTITGRFSWRDMTPELWAALVSGSTATTGVIHHISKEAVAISSDTATVAQTPYQGADGAGNYPMVVVGPTGKTYKQVASAPGAGEYSISGQVLTFEASELEDDEIVTISYFYSADSGTKVSFSPSDIPGATHYLFAMKIYSCREGAWKGYLVGELKKVVRTSAVGIGPGVADAATMGFDWKATIDVATDGYLAFSTS